MRKLIFLLFGFLLPTLMSGQVTVINNTRQLIEIDGVSVPARSRAQLNLDVNKEIAAFDAIYYEGLEQKGPTRMYRRLRGDRIILQDFEENSDLADEFNESTEEEASASSYRERPSYADGSWWATVNVRPQNNLEDQSIFVPTEPFLGLALKPGQVSEKTASLRTGKIMFPVMLGSDDEKTRTGMTFTWALVHKIVTEGEDSLKINADDIMMANSGKIVRKRIGSLLPFDFMISEGASRGTVVPANSIKRLELYVGWNILPIQYKDRNGLPTEAILILLVNDRNDPLWARAKREEDRITISEDDIRIANYR